MGWNDIHFQNYRMYASANRITTGSNNNGLSAIQVNIISLLSLVEADSMTTSSNGNIFRVTGHLCGEFTGHRWISRTKASDAELWCVLLSAPEYTAGGLNREAGGLRRHRAHYDVTVMGWEFENMSSRYDGFVPSPAIVGHCPASRTTLVATRFRVAVICPIIQVPHCIRVFFYFVWFVFINHIFQFYHELCTYCNILDIYLS